MNLRVARSRAAVVEATRSLLRESGFRGTTIEAISELSGVAKTTIYRNWKDRNELLLDAFSLEAESFVFPATDDLRADLLSGLQSLNRALQTSEWVTLMPAMIEASERDPDFLSLSRAFVDSRRKPLKDRLQLAVKRQEVAAETDVELLVSVLAGPLFYRRLVARQSMKRVSVEDLVDLVIDGVSGRSSSG